MKIVVSPERNAVRADLRDRQLTHFMYDNHRTAIYESNVKITLPHFRKKEWQLHHRAPLPPAVAIRLTNFLMRNLCSEIKSDSTESFRRRYSSSYIIIIFIIYPIIILLIYHITINFLLFKLRYFGIFSFWYQHSAF